MHPWLHSQLTNSVRTTRVRDLTVMRLGEGFVLGVACDSVGGIGAKALDTVFAEPFAVGYFALRVPVMELVSLAFRPFLIVDPLCVESGTYSEEILAGMKALAAEIELTDPCVFNGSTEDNVITNQTGVGVVVLGLAHPEEFVEVASTQEHMLVAAGLPKSAPNHEVHIGDPEILSMRDLRWLRRQTGVGDIVPVGSRGIAHEVEQLAASANLAYRFEDVDISLHASGGPSACVVFSCLPEICAQLAEGLSCPLTPIGRFIETDGRRNMP